MSEHYTIYTDVTGRPLKVGQIVAYCVGGNEGKQLRVAKVTKLYPKTVELETELPEWRSKPLRRNHSVVAIVRDAE